MFNFQEEVSTIRGLQRASNLDTSEFRRGIDVDGLIEIILNFENGIGGLNSLILKLKKRIELLESTF